MALYPRLAVVFLLLCLTSFGVACGGSGDDDDGHDQNSDQICEDTTRVLAGVDEVSTLLGKSAADLLDDVGNGFTITAQYTEDTTILTQSPLGGETNLTVTVSYNGGEIREVDSTPVNGGSAGDCPDRLEIDVAITFSTADGAFAETWPAVLTQSVSSDQAGLADPTLAAEFDPAGIDGSFEIVSIAGVTPDSVTGVLDTTAVDPVQGSVDILVQQTTGEGNDGTVSQTRHVALSWGAAR